MKYVAYVVANIALDTIFVDTIWDKAEREGGDN